MVLSEVMSKLAKGKTEAQSPGGQLMLWPFLVLFCFAFEMVSLAFCCYDKTRRRPTQGVVFGLHFVITVHH